MRALVSSSGLGKGEAQRTWIGEVGFVASGFVGDIFRGVSFHDEVTGFKRDLRFGLFKIFL
jgi:hypothetical protein